MAAKSGGDDAATNIVDGVSTSPSTAGADERAAGGVCALLTDAEVAEALGGEVNHTNIDGSDAAGPGCHWILADQSPADLVSITMFTEFDEDRLESIIISDPENDALRDIADGARVSVGIAEVLVTDTGFMLQVTPFRALDIESVAALAAAAADRF